MRNKKNIKQLKLSSQRLIYIPINSLIKKNLHPCLFTNNLSLQKHKKLILKLPSYILCVMVCKIIKAQNQEINRLLLLLHVMAYELDKRPKRSSIQTYQLVVFILEYYFTNLTQDFYN